MQWLQRMTVCSVAMVLVGCGGGTSLDTTITTLPSAPADELVAAVASFDVAVGTQERVLVGLLTGDQRDIGLGSVELRSSYQGDGDGSAQADDPGPWVPAEFLALTTDDALPEASQPQLLDGPDGRGVYGAPMAFDRSGFYQLEVRADVDGLGEKTATAALRVNDEPQFPKVGDDAPATNNLTLSSDVDPSAVDSRARDGVDIPDPNFHDTTMDQSIAAARPSLVAFTTPAFCRSRFCGPTLDLMNQVDAQYSNSLDVIHVEVWKDFEAQQPNDIVETWIVRNDTVPEPWVFLLDSEGVIQARWDNVVTKAEIDNAVMPLLAAG